MPKQLGPTNGSTCSATMNVSAYHRTTSTPHLDLFVLIEQRVDLLSQVAAKVGRPLAPQLQSIAETSIAFKQLHSL